MVDQDIGSVPFKTLLVRSKLVRLDSVDQDIGSVPFKTLLLKDNALRLDSVDQGGGRVPVCELAVRSRAIKPVRDDHEEGKGWVGKKVSRRSVTPR